MKTNKKYIIGVIGTLFLGSIWNRLTEPFFNFSSNILLNIISLGIKKYKNQIYLEVAKNLHESASAELFELIIISLCSITLMMLLTLFLRKNFMKFNEKFKEHMISEDKKIVKIFVFFYLIFFIGLSFSMVLKTTFINKSVTRYNQLFNVTAPYTNESDKLIIQSKFAQIESKENYDELIKFLTQIAKQNNIKVENFEKN